MTRERLLAFVGALDMDLRNMFIAADDYVKMSRDTLSTEFQIASKIVDVFVEEAARRISDG